MSELHDIADLLARSAERCPPLLKILRTGHGGLHMANLVIRHDGRTYNVEADWVDDLVRLLHAALESR